MTKPVVKEKIWILRRCLDTCGVVIFQATKWGQKMRVPCCEAGGYRTLLERQHYALSTEEAVQGVQERITKAIAHCESEIVEQQKRLERLRSLNAAEIVAKSKEISQG